MNWKIISLILALVAIASIGFAVTRPVPKQELPLWAYGLEDHIAEMTFISPEAHYNYVIENGLEYKYTDYITTIRSNSENPLDEFARCLTQKGLMMYGAEWCSHCQNQKNLFGDSFQFVNYIECTTNEEVCQVANITGFPTFIIGNARFSGEKSLEELGTITGCVI